ncbi:hypothetical protein [Hyalangium versicolor]|uniref:hypothetical protein n=1 Tax=Hyalangium versicolor TaxID=2861190 RepID=UPI001CCA765C|nr:hypothetical protein [Hyalangium versicolor]
MGEALQFWTELARLAKPCEASRFPDKEGDSVCQHHGGKMVEGSLCQRAAPHRDAKLSTAAEPHQLSLFDAEGPGNG